MNPKIVFEVKKHPYGIYEIEAPMGERIYFLLGKERDAIIDTGMGIGSLKEVVDSISKKERIVIDTHGHPDHAGGNIEFPEVYLSPLDEKVYEEMSSLEYRACDIKKIMGENGENYIRSLLPLKKETKQMQEGDTFPLGGRTLRAFGIAGHTRGSFVIYDDLSSTLFVGDAISIKDTWLYLPYSTGLKTYLSSIEHFLGYGLSIKTLFSGHEPNKADPSLFDSRIVLLKKIIAGEIVGKDAITFAGKGLRAEYEGNSLIYDKARINE